MVRCWSSLDAAALPPRIPGVTITKSGPQARRIAEVSCGDATTPSRPDACASSARRTTWSSGEAATPTDASVEASRLVSTVTAITSGRVPPADCRSSARSSRCLHHRTATARVDVHHPHAEIRRRLNRSRHRVRYVVEFQIQEHSIAASHHRPDDLRPGCGKQLAADFESTDGAAECVGQRKGSGSAWNVEGDKDSVHLVLSRNPKGPDEVRDPRDTVPGHVVVESGRELAPDERIDEVRRADLHCR